MLDPHRPYGLDNLPPDDRARRTHPHVYVVERLQFCPGETACLSEHLNDCTQAHHTYEHIAGSRERAEAFIRHHATADPLLAWEVWEEAVDSYDPYEEPDDDTEYWQYAGDGTPLNPYEWWQRYTGPLYGWDWHGADRWRDEALARQQEPA